MTTPAVKAECDLAATAEQLTAQMEALAASGDWSQVAELASSIEKALLAVPEPQREAAMLSAKRRLARVQTAALSSRNDISAKLSQIRRGQRAAEAYADADSGQSPAVLR